jgi:hypothetical protein
MADQLTSVGVEFSRTEMARVFYSVNPEAEVRKWGFGKTRQPTGIGAIPDKIYSVFALPFRRTMELPPRTPGKYTDDGSTTLLTNANELVHPCVRIRYLYGGRELEDAGQWRCRALTEASYELVSQDAADTLTVRSFRAAGAVGKTYQSLNASVAPYFDIAPQSPDADSTYVRTEQPNEQEDLFQLTPPTTHWVWKSTDGKTVLPEEALGMWERMFIRINDKMLAWQDAAKTASGTTEATGKAATARTPLPAGAAPEYGYHDIVSWQHADTTKNYSA